jgi:cell division septal protein FtsQ
MSSHEKTTNRKRGKTLKTKIMLFTGMFVMGVLMAGLALTISYAANPSANNSNTIVSTGNRTVSMKLQCKNPGSQQDVGKTPNIINNTTKTIPKGQKVYWKTNKGENGEIELTSPLAPGGSVSGLGQAGQVYTCTAWTAQVK